MMIGVLGSLAEYERELIKERTALKRETSRANGTKFGRPRKVDDNEHITTAKEMKADGRSRRCAAKNANTLPAFRRCPATDSASSSSRYYPIDPAHRNHRQESPPTR